MLIIQEDNYTIMKKIVTALLLVTISTLALAQEKEKPFKVEIHGFVGVNAYFDSRQSAAARNGNIYLWPLPPKPDAEGNDLNAESKFDIDAAYSRFNVGISGPDVFGAKSFAFMEGDFLGGSGTRDVNFRMRHAFVRLNWEKSSLLMGQYWHPLFVTENYPSTVTLSCGVPFHPLNRQPMIRFGHQLSDQFEIIAFLMSQNDFADKGMTGAMENSLRPEMTLQAKYKNDKGFFASATAGFKSFRPELVDPNDGIITKELAQSSYFAGSIRQKFSGLTVKAEGIYGGGMTNQVMLGGFAEKNNGSTQRQYTALQTMSLWTDIHTNHEKVRPGIFIGYTENMGAKDKANMIDGANGGHPFVLGSGIGNMYTVAPRVVFYAHPKIYFGVEWMHTVASYGAGYDDYAKPIDLESVSNNRITLSTRYTF